MNTHTVFLCRSPTGRNVSWFCCQCRKSCARHPDVLKASGCAAQHHSIVVLYDGANLSRLSIPELLS